MTQPAIASGDTAPASAWQPPFCRMDTHVHPRMRVYSAGNFGEVAPERLSPMSWSLVGRPMELGTRRFTGRVLGHPRWTTGSTYVFTGYHGLRPYHNLTAYCHVADNVVLTEPRDVTDAYFEGVAPPPPSDIERVMGWRKVMVGPRMFTELLGLRTRNAKLEQQVFAFEQDVREAAAAGIDWRLGEFVMRGKRLLEIAWEVHITCTSGAVAAEVIRRKVTEKLVPNADSVAGWLREPAELPWTRLFGLGSMKDGPASFLDKVFYEVADQHSPWSEYALRPLAQPMEGNGGAVDVSPREALIGMRETLRGRAVDASVLFLGDMMSVREQSKSLAMRLLHVHRTLARELARCRGVAHDDWPYLSMDELSGQVVPTPAEIERRRESCAEALGLVMPDYLDLRPGASPDAVPRRRPTGVSPGVFEGVAIGIEDMPTEEGVVLVCESADANIMPILPFVGAVVTARGSQYSHVAILCREMGVPAVVSHPLAGEIAAGRRVHVNGDTGEVRTLD
ncbi:PEP-utilizing enzyme [Streptomyces sp. H27-D2]|uniref:PEP-utilizing enzyme n=1 Tax=Streptomyces sp. H27-D2 TaxID=3046304 RepID=UPI002DBBF29F|nr:PEP-utilizing enzyme [Streptomyces sp. H27-D2]MEC4015027.1 PEP-utilizing enzyme [Streptomyces sp. H27-D2]